MRQRKTLKGIGAIKYGIDWFEEVVNLLSGPLLAVSAAVAIVDLLTDGQIHISLQPLAIGWAIAQGFGLDFQLLSLGYKARSAMQEGKKARFAGVMVIALILGAVALQSGAIFAAQSAQAEGISHALLQLDINPTILIYERAGLAVLLLFIAGWNKHDIEEDAQPTAKARELDYNALATALLPLLAPMLTEHTRTIVTEEVHAIAAPAPSEPAEERSGTDGNTATEPTTPTPAIAGTTDEKLAAAYQMLLAERTRISGDTLSKKAGVRKATALAWLRANGTAEEQESAA